MLHVTRFDTLQPGLHAHMVLAKTALAQCTIWRAGLYSCLEPGALDVHSSAFTLHIATRMLRTLLNKSNVWQLHACPVTREWPACKRTNLSLGL